MAAHRYWRLRGFHHRGGTFSGTILTLIIDIEMRDAIGGADLTSAAQAIGTAGYGAGEEPDKAFDNNAATWWQGTGSVGWTLTNNWIGQDFGAGNEKEIVEVALTHHATYLTRTWDMILVEYSDDAVSWVTDWYIANIFPAAQTVVSKPSGDGAANHRYWGVICMDSGFNSTRYVAASEIEFFQEATLVPTTGGAGIAKGSHASGTIAGAFDGSTATMWASDMPGASMIGYDWGAGNEKANIDGCGWRARNDSAFNQLPKFFFIGYSDDGKGFGYQVGFSDRMPYRQNERRRYLKKLDAADAALTFLTSLTPDIVNAGGASIVGWTATTGAIRSSGAYLWSTAAVRAEWSQTVAIAADYHAAIDEGKCVVKGQVELMNYGGDADTGAFWFECLNAAGKCLAKRSGYYEDAHDDAWAIVSGYIAIPPGTRSIKIGSRAIRAEGSNNDSYWRNYVIDIYQRTWKVDYLLTNGTWQSAVAEGWTNAANTIGHRSNNSIWNDDFWSGTTNGSNIAQRAYKQVDIPAARWGELDAGQYAIRLDLTLSAYSGDNDTCRVYVELMDAGGAVLATNASTGAAYVPSANHEVWRITLNAADIPVGTRKFRVHFESNTVGTSEANADGMMSKLAVSAYGGSLSGIGGADRRRQDSLIMALAA